MELATIIAFLDKMATLTFVSTIVMIIGGIILDMFIEVEDKIKEKYISIIRYIFITFIFILMALIILSVAI